MKEGTEARLEQGRNVGRLTDSVIERILNIIILILTERIVKSLFMSK